MPALLTWKFTWAVVVIAVVMAAFGIQGGRLRLAEKAAQTAQDGWASCRASVATQNAAIAVQAARSAAALASAAKTQAAVAPLAAHHASRAIALSAYKPKGADRCAMLEDAVAEARRSFE